MRKGESIGREKVIVVFDHCVWRVGQWKGMMSRSGAFNILAMGRIRALQITITIKHVSLI